MADKVRVTPQQGAQTWQSQFSASGAKYTAGIQSVTTSPNAKAAAAVMTWQARLADPKTQAKYVAKNNAVSLTDWKNNAVNIGASRLSSGATKGAPKMQTFATQFYPFLDGVLSKVQSMPNVTLEQRIARATTLMTENAKFTQQ